MKPIKIEFQAFGPYTGHEVVDFNEIASKGLFLICGKTGIGKTMILDAMTFALYGKSSGNVRDDFEAMRSTNADFNTPTFVKFIFENNGDYYLFERRLERKRTNLSASYNMQKKGDDGVWKCIDTENPRATDLNNKAVELIGLEYGQFSQVIVLPQGKFEKLLTSNSDEKEKILTSIFGEDKWKYIAEKFFEETQQRKTELENKKQRIDRSLEDEDCDTFADLHLIIEHKEKELSEINEDFLKEDFSKKNEDLQKQLMLINSFKNLHNHENALRDLKEQKDDRKAWEETLLWGTKADKTRKYIDAFDSALKELNDRESDERKALKDKGEKEKAFEKAEKNYNDIIAKKEEVEEYRKKKIEYEGKTSDYEGLESASNEVKTLKSNLKKDEKTLNEAKDSYEQYAQVISSLKDKYDELQAEHNNLLNTYLAGITGELATKLEEGKPCPVCGSTTHPMKASVAENNVSKEDVDAKKIEADDAYKNMNDAVQEQNAAKDKYDSLKKEYDNAKEVVIKKETKLKAMQKSLIAGIESFKDLNTAISNFKKAIDFYETTLANAEKDKTSATKYLTEAESKFKACEKETKKAKDKYKKAEEELNKSLSDNEFEDTDSAREFLLTPEEIEEYQKEIAEYDANVKSEEKQIKDLMKALKDVDEPDETECKKAIKELDDRKVEFEKQKAFLEGEINRLKAKEESLLKESEGLPEQIRIASEDYLFAKKLRGDSGTGLQRYVLGIMFSQVIASANKMLEMVHGGRYRLFRSDDKAQGSNKRGLDLKVYDSHSAESEGRFVSTLSGGEKFLASLALSIGMSTIAQKSGIKIEALFIDEGFGSLDEDSIGDAMNILNSIQEANGLVGIISHVQILQDRIPSKLMVEQHGKGSHIVQTIG